MCQKTKCPIDSDKCPCEEYSKEKLCDFPYRNRMTWDQIKSLSKVTLDYYCLRCGTKMTKLKSGCSICGAKVFEAR